MGDQAEREWRRGGVSWLPRVYRICGVWVLLSSATSLAASVRCLGHGTDKNSRFGLD